MQLKPAGISFSVTLRLIAFALLAAASIFVLALVATFSSIKSLQAGNFQTASVKAKAAHYPVEILSALLRNKSNTIEAWRLGLQLAISMPNALNEAASSSQSENTVLDFNKLAVLFGQKSKEFNSFNKAVQNSLISKAFPTQTNEIDTASETLQSLAGLATNLSEKNQTWIIVLQNSDEIRASGGFAGSYITVPVIDGKISSFVVEDIYDADGQFEGYIEAPPGAKEYLSSNRGLRLPDANWHADFPSSADQMLQFFAFGNKQNVHGLVAVNLHLAEAVLGMLGPVNLPDYDALLTPDNLSQELRKGRDDFFPGSIQKKHILSQVAIAVVIELKSIGPTAVKDLGALLKQSVIEKNILAFARDPEMQIFIENLGADGSLLDPESDYLYLVESNVAINKANKGISRELAVNWDQQLIEVLLTFTNNNLPPEETSLSGLIPSQQEIENRNQAEHNGYINYQRVLMPQHWEVETINYRDNSLTKWDEEIIKDSHGNSYKQIGFLITLPEREQGSLEIKILPLRDKAPKSLILQKQPGTPSYEVSLTSPSEKITKHFVSDLVFPLE